jgi:hypothetical protein
MAKLLVRFNSEPRSTNPSLTERVGVGICLTSFSLKFFFIKNAFSNARRVAGNCCLFQAPEMLDDISPAHRKSLKVIYSFWDSRRLEFVFGLIPNFLVPKKSI